MRILFKTAASMIFLTAISLAACTKTSTNTTVDCTGVTPTYTNDIKAIMTANCAISGCHTTLSSAGGYDLTNYANCKNAKDRISGSVQHNSGYQSMPQAAAKLDDATIKKIVCWVQNGCMQ